MGPKISIIIPIYNSELYLEDCLNSVINQSLREIEIICVVNGSADNSLTIVERYASIDSRLKLITKKEADLGGARNTGIREATGEYLMFVDSDDWIKLEACEKLYEVARTHNLDILQGLHHQVPNKFVAFFRCKRKLFYNLTTGMEFWKYNSNISAANWDKLWKHSFFTENNLYNPEGVYYEDNMTSIKGMLTASRFMAINYKFYYYRCVETSITHMAISEKHIISYKKLTENIDAFIKVNNLHKNSFFITYYFKSLFIYYALFKKGQTKEMKSKLCEIDRKLISNFPLRIKVSSYLPLTASRVYKVWIKREALRCFIARIIS